NQTIRVISATGVVTTLAGTVGATGAADGSGSAARFNYPQDVVVDGVGDLYVADGVNHVIRKITSSGVVTTWAGAAGQPGTANGTGRAASFYGPCGLPLDSAGNLYVADTYNQLIRKITAARVVTTVAGAAGVPGYAEGIGIAAQFNYPLGLVARDAQTICVAD